MECLYFTNIAIFAIFRQGATSRNGYILKINILLKYDLMEQGIDS